MFLGGAPSVIAAGATECAAQLKVLIFIHKTPHKAMSLIGWTAKGPRLISLLLFVIHYIVKKTMRLQFPSTYVRGAEAVDVDFSLSWQECPQGSPWRLGLPGAVHL